ncbi:hypothetical protein VB780_05260 [Leptolyngbya sp. CCNP1308]|uniref:hypothetical protein n=1 Tax=Leptolyngbya sp. CCNP1308 TaxID=3110255 RepID=UPI002B217F77|nr:hypothetical protein [Leptolyngbya sp. CCNP1308]MEA5447967.1 hypothetical protein [Leptolyngbya sp. CCNP1308]
MAEDKVVQAQEVYEPKIINDFQLAGLTAETSLPGKEVKIIQKMFTSSLDEHFSLHATQLLSPILGTDPGSFLNSLLVLIEPNNKAYVYEKFPFGVTAIPKTPVEPYRAVFKNNLADITAVFFQDIVIDLNPKDGDRIVWLFRENWHFGLFFDLSGNLNSRSTLNEMGACYRRLAYLSEYLFLENSSNFKQMVEDGWFPFVAIISDGMEKVQLYYQEGGKYPSILQELIDSFNEQRILALISNWWQNSLFARNRKIIQAGINSYLTNTEDGYISAVKIFSTELEGIIRIAYHQDFNKKPKFRELKEYISNKGKSKFSSLGSLCFPDKFLDYLNDYIFRDFDVQVGYAPESRHSVAHGVAQDNIYTQEFALKLLLTLDNIYFFLGNR